ncbi:MULTISPECIES: tripartite tricarboxylate transporter TctB family protein [unclassified Mameliella]|uniref:tripartite tricarboxylate transporter TctB family protein n=1 Tax=unclassified Mameliella TaxID=2630630 RepID=UPI00273FC375|nr:MULTISPECIES: tripartite tricarboxylate transporter TctB family protein [unclassified Mameliella]
MDQSTDEALADQARLRARDFWGALGLIALSLFFLWRTLDIPMGGSNGVGVNSAAWYTSAAIVPLGIFGALLALSLVLLGISIRSGGAAYALSAVGIGWNPREVWRFVAVALMLLAYIAGLVPRVDFILSSALLITALIASFHGHDRPRPLLPLLTVAAAGVYALVAHMPRSEWGQHDDDWVALALLVGLTLWHQWTGHMGRALRLTPVLAVGVPLILVCAMAFGFRQNVPNRGGLIFAKIEYTYYVHLRPIWRS